MANTYDTRSDGDNELAEDILAVEDIFEDDELSAEERAVADRLKQQKLDERERIIRRAKIIISAAIILLILAMAFAFGSIVHRAGNRGVWM